MEVTTTYNHRFRPNSCIPDLIRDHHSLSLDGIGQVTIHLQRLSSFSSCCLSARIKSHNISVHRRYCSWRHESGCRGSLRVCFQCDHVVACRIWNVVLISCLTIRFPTTPCGQCAFQRDIPWPTTSLSGQASMFGSDAISGSAVAWYR